MSDTERRRSRFRTETDDGTEIGVVVGRELRSGDVLVADDQLIVISLDSITAMVLFSAVKGTGTTVSRAVALGHAIGNNHWTLAIEDDRVYLPVDEERERKESEIESWLLNGVTIDYESVEPALFDGSSTPARDGEGHGHDHGHTHSHSDQGHVQREHDQDIGDSEL